MAARRLAISSLLCDDDAHSPSASAPPKYGLDPSPDSFPPPPHRSHRSQERPNSSYTSATHLPPPLDPVRDFVPLSLQTAGLRRRTPSPDSSPRPYHFPDRQMEYGGRPTSAGTGGRGSVAASRREYYDPLPADRQRLLSYQPSPQHPAHMSRSPPSPPLSHNDPHFTRMPSHSPASQSTVSLLSQQHAASPPLYSHTYPHPPPASPVNFYQPEPSPSSHHRANSRQQQQQQQSLPFPPQFSPRPRPESSLSGPAYSPSISRPVTASATFPRSILNPVSPSMQSPLGGLEALVQAATVERRRLSGTGSSANERRLDGFRASASRSPEVNFRRVADSSSSQSLRSTAVAATSPPFAIPEPVQRAPPSSQAFISAELDTSHRSHKRKRRSDSYLGSDREHSTMEPPSMPMDSRRDVGAVSTEARRPLIPIHGRVEASHSPVRGRGMELLADVTQELRGAGEGRRDISHLSARRPWEDPPSVAQRYPQPSFSKAVEPMSPAVVGWREGTMDHEVAPFAPAARDPSPIQVLPPRFQRSTPPTQIDTRVQAVSPPIRSRHSATRSPVLTPTISHSPVPSGSRSRSPPAVQTSAPTARAPSSNAQMPSDSQVTSLPVTETPTPHAVYPNVAHPSTRQKQVSISSASHVPTLAGAPTERSPGRPPSPSMSISSPLVPSILLPPPTSPPRGNSPSSHSPLAVIHLPLPDVPVMSSSVRLPSPHVGAPSPIVQDPSPVEHTALPSGRAASPEILPPSSPCLPSPAPLPSRTKSAPTPLPSMPLSEISVPATAGVPSVLREERLSSAALPTDSVDDEEKNLSSQQLLTESPIPLVESEVKPEPTDTRSADLSAHYLSQEATLKHAETLASPPVSNLVNGERAANQDSLTKSSEDPRHDEVDAVEKTAEVVSPSTRPVSSLALMNEMSTDGPAAVPLAPTRVRKAHSRSPPLDKQAVIVPTTPDATSQPAGESPPADEPRVDATTVNSVDQELEDVANAVPDSHSMDIDIDHELAQELGLANEPHPRGEQVRMDMDVDDELLSLIEDRPSLRPTEAPRMHHRPPKSKMSAPTKAPSPVNASTVPLPSSHRFLPSRSTSAAVNSGRESMPPPATTPRDGSRDRAPTPKADDRSQTSSKKKPKQPPKQPPQPKLPRPKASTSSTKTKSKPPKEDASILGIKGKKGSPVVPSTMATAKASSSTARSRSTSVMPGPGSAGVEATKGDKCKHRTAEEEEESDGEDKLYCICKTKYDDEKVMIACDRCDEWYHTACVSMSDDEVDLVDQFICPSCVEKEPQLDLRTTYKRRCLYGLKQRNSNSPDACHKPARGALSKYCSDECGIKYMQMRIAVWTNNGGDKERLWESVKNAERREGVVISTQLAKGQDDGPVNGKPRYAVPGIVKPSKTKVDRELERLRAQLDDIVRKREDMRKEMDIVVWREKVTYLAIRRADTIEDCGWDQRLCFGDEEVVEFGGGVLENYEVGETSRATDAMQLDGPGEEPVWWCSGKKKCDRHAGWQKLRSAEVQFDKEMKEQALHKLTTREREIRKRVEDIVDPHARLPAATANPPSSPPRTVPETKSVANGSKPRPNGDSKKGKRKKNEVF